MVGQEHITKTLKNQIIADRIGHAYLFNGTRGTGKTSAAKIFARAINCLHPKEGEPCNECEVCEAMLSGSLTDIVEMDAASNNSVDDIRSIRDEVNFLPTVAKYRVYIIDEVHMLSTGAFNALLKTLEEPPAHVKFILATTEPQKLPATILSRCQRFDFKSLSNENIIKRLKIVCQESNIEIKEEALTVIAALSEGALRDALSILERCMQEGTEYIDEDMVKELIGIPKLTFIHQIVSAIITYDVDKALQTMQEVIKDGKDVNNLVWELIKYIRDILICKANSKLEIYSKSELENIKQLAQEASKERLIQLVYTLSELENTMKWSSQKTIMLQAGLIKLCSKIEQAGIEELKKKVIELEEKINSGAVKVVTQASNINQVKTAPMPKAPITKKVVVDIKSEGFWPGVLNDLKTSGKMVLYSNLINTKAQQVGDNMLEVIFPNGLTPFGRTMLERPENVAELENLVSTACGKDMKIKYMDIKEKEEQLASNTLEDRVKGLDIPINIIEE